MVLGICSDSKRFPVLRSRKVGVFPWQAALGEAICAINRLACDPVCDPFGAGAYFGSQKAGKAHFKLWENKKGLQLASCNP